MPRIGSRARAPGETSAIPARIQPTGPRLGQPRTQADGEVVTESNLRLRAAAHGTVWYAIPVATILNWRAGDRLLCASPAGLHPETGQHPGS